MVLKLLHELDMQTAPEANIDKKVILNKVGEKAFWLPAPVILVHCNRRGSRGGEMGEFSPPFFWAPFFLFFSYPSNIEIIFDFFDIITKIHPPFQNPGSALDMHCKPLIHDYIVYAYRLFSFVMHRSFILVSSNQKFAFGNYFLPIIIYWFLS